MTPVNDQIYYFAVTIFLGFMIGITFDIYNTLRIFFKLKKILTAFFDFLCWFFLTVIVFAILFYANYAEIRFYIFIGMGTGVVIYKKTLSDLLKKSLEKIISFFKKI
jgi:spore cortex biosynthesis protein YabQ